MVEDPQPLATAYAQVSSSKGKVTVSMEVLRRKRMKR